MQIYIRYIRRHMTVRVTKFLQTHLVVLNRGQTPCIPIRCQSATRYETLTLSNVKGTTTSRVAPVADSLWDVTIISCFSLSGNDSWARPSGDSRSCARWVLVITVFRV